MKKIKIIAVIVNANTVSLYKEDGEEITIKQGNISSASVIEKAVADIQKHGEAVIELSSAKNAPEEFALYEKLSGVARFFTVAKKFIDNLFDNSNEVEEGKVYGTPPQDTADKEHQSKEKHKEALAAILDDSPEVHPEGKSLDTSIAKKESVTIAVVGDTIVPNVDALTAQAKHAENTQHSAGMDNLLQRLAAMIHTRQHSVEDLLKFLERADLPIMEDGSILAYKRVKPTKQDGVYVDVHSGKVTQWVGCEVMMSPDMVDTNRRNECSQGLHVARLGYLPYFSGSVILFIKVAPEDVIAVPHRDANKVRVAKYHIIGKATDEMFTKLSKGTSLKGHSDSEEVLSQFLAGNHIGITDTVEITGAKGNGLVHTKHTSPVEPVPAKEVVKQTPIEPSTAPEDTPKGDSVNVKVAVKGKAKPKRKGKRKSTATKPLSPRQQIAKLLPVTTKKQAAQVLMLKRKAKKGWSVLGVSTEQQELITSLLKD